MSLLSLRQQVKLSQQQILTPSLLQMVKLLQMNRLELKEMINQELVENPVIEESLDDSAEELTPDELERFLEDRVSQPEDRILEGAMVDSTRADAADDVADIAFDVAAAADPAQPEAATDAEKAADPFDEIDFGSFFDDYLDPGYKSPASEAIEKPSFETFLSQPVTLSDHLRSQLALIILTETERDAAEAVIGNLDDTGYLAAPIEEIAATEEIPLDVCQAGLHAVQTFDPAGVAARDLRECLLLQIESRNGRGSVAWQIVENWLHLVEKRDVRELARVMARPADHLEIALRVIRHLDPAPGLRYSGAGARVVEPDVFIFKDGDEFVIQMNDEDVPQIRLNGDYRRMLERGETADKDLRNYVKERFSSALQLMKNIEQRKQTIVKVCQSIVRRQTEVLAGGMDFLRPMMIKEIAEEVGVHPSTVSRAVSGKYAHTPQGVIELRAFFSEAVQGPSGGDMSLIVLKKKVRKMIDEEDKKAPLTDDHITAKLNDEGIQVTRRTVAKYREDMKIPSTHKRRVKE